MLSYHCDLIIVLERRYNMNGSQVIKQLMIESDTDINQLAELLEIQPQSVRNKLSRNSFTLSEFEKVVNLLGGQLQVVSERTKNIYH